MRTLTLSLLVFAGLIPVHAFETLEFDDNTGLFIGTPEGYTGASALFGPVQVEEGMSDGAGMLLTIGVGQGTVIYGPPMSVGSGKCLLEVSVWCTGSGAALALALAAVGHTAARAASRTAVRSASGGTPARSRRSVTAAETRHRPPPAWRRGTELGAAAPHHPLPPSTAAAAAPRTITVAAKGQDGGRTGRGRGANKVQKLWL